MSTMSENRWYQPQNQSNQMVLHQPPSQNAPGEMMLYQPPPYPAQQSNDSTAGPGPIPAHQQQTPTTAAVAQNKYNSKKKSTSPAGGPLRKGLENLVKLVERKIDQQIETARARAENADQRSAPRVVPTEKTPQGNMERKQYG
ncbi:hypothetical protein GMOD_00008269 [Pyrenophora seminiperda CCB06]|uniref:Uncharacterized protein n=1 Tax=Pyrenophora seminiperda CCB06 TaxID=1302712 RepID=A0A3M7M241_9PLEO|nr:hypothetical protein GMOD_00008269 [Pyrenophora seminiperda CCB06]